MNLHPDRIGEQSRVGPRGREVGVGVLEVQGDTTRKGRTIELLDACVGSGAGAGTDAVDGRRRCRYQLGDDREFGHQDACAVGSRRSRCRDGGAVHRVIRRRTSRGRRSAGEGDQRECDHEDHAQDDRLCLSHLTPPFLWKMFP